MSRYIDADELKKELKAWATNLLNPKMLVKEDAEVVIDDAPSIDIVRCKECRFYDENDRGYCDLQSMDGWKADDFCSYGCRKEE